MNFYKELIYSESENYALAILILLRRYSKLLDIKATQEINLSLENRNKISYSDLRYKSITLC